MSDFVSVLLMVLLVTAKRSMRNHSYHASSSGPITFFVENLCFAVHRCLCAVEDV